MSAQASYDVLDVSDLRFPGGTSHSIAEEVIAQTAAGWSTGLIHLNGPLIERVLPINPLIARLVHRGQATLIVSPEPVRSAVTVVRHPAVLQHGADQLPPITTERVVVIANAGPYDIDGRQHYDPAAVDAVARKHFGVDPVWAPIGPLVRASITSTVSAERMLSQDWVNVIDVDAWRVDRPEWQGERPVVGRHSRPSPQKWPSDPDTLREVYPVDGSWDVRVLGGAQPVRDLLGAVPDTWNVKPFGALSPREFLGGLDFFVYYHAEHWVEAFGRTILEAIASGVPAVLPPHFRALFEGAAVYAEPRQVREVVQALRADRSAYEAHVAAAEQVVRERFGHEAHRLRISELIGTQARAVQRRDEGTQLDAAGQLDVDEHGDVPPQLPATRLYPTRWPGLHRPRVLLMSSNGAGMGHLTRLLSYATRLQDEADVRFLSLSHAVPIAGSMGFDYEYLPSAPSLGMPLRLWQNLYVDRAVETLDRVRPDVVVFDGTWPYTGTEKIMAAHPDTRWIWSRRGMWRPSARTPQMARTDWFDAVLEPGDLAAPYDQGATSLAQAHRVGPVTLLDAADLVERSTARTILGLPQEPPLALISLGAGNINDTSGDIGAATRALRELGVEVCVTNPEIARTGRRDRDVHVVRQYPMSRCYAAFDVVISASGYNSFHELLRMGVPTLFVPNAATSLDDQDARARYAEDQGWAHRLESLTGGDTRRCLSELLTHGRSMVSGAVDADPGNGAAEGAAYILAVARGEDAR